MYTKISVVVNVGVVVIVYSDCVNPGRVNPASVNSARVRGTPV